VGASIGVSAGVLWSASSGLFYWVLSDIARHTNDTDLAGRLSEIDRENLGWFGLDDITPGQRGEVRRIVTEHLVEDAEREFPADAPGRASGLELLKELAAIVSADADQ
jgi:hypothetical protein